MAVILPDSREQKLCSKSIEICGIVQGDVDLAQRVGWGLWVGYPKFGRSVLGCTEADLRAHSAAFLKSYKIDTLLHSFVGRVACCPSFGGVFMGKHSVSLK